MGSRIKGWRHHLYAVVSTVVEKKFKYLLLRFLPSQHIHIHVLKPTAMTRVLLTGGSGFIAAHTLDVLLKRGHSVVTTVRTQEKADKIEADNKEAVEKDQLGFAIVPDIAQEGAFDEAVKSDPPFEVVLHTASPFHFNVTDVKKVSATYRTENQTRSS